MPTVTEARKAFVDARNTVLVKQATRAQKELAFLAIPSQSTFDALTTARASFQSAYDAMSTALGIYWATLTPPPPPPPPPAPVRPVLSYNYTTGVLSWSKITGGVYAKVVEKRPGMEDVYKQQPDDATLCTPVARPGEAVTYGLGWYKTDGTLAGDWALELQVLYPAPPVPPTPPAGSQIIGLCLGGWGPQAYKDMVAAGITTFRTATEADLDQIKAAGGRCATFLRGEGGSGSTFQSSLGQTPKQYADAMRATVDKYGLIRWELFNEPNGPWFWPNCYQDYAGYVAFAKEAKAALAGTNCKLACEFDEGGGWRAGILAAGILQYADEVVCHPYGGKDSKASSALGHRDKVEKAYQDSGGKKVAITEVGWPTAVGQPSTGDSLQWTEQEQADNIKSFCQWVLAHPEMISTLTLFQYRDYSSNMWYGIQSHEGRVKPGQAALAAYATK